jgi:hypothetical protein
VNLDESKRQADKISKIHSSLIGGVWFWGAVYWYFNETNMIYVVLVCITFHLLINLSSILAVGNVYKYSSLVEQSLINKKLDKLLSKKENGVQAVQTGQITVGWFRYASPFSQLQFTPNRALMSALELLAQS